jgi:hypothetical protein
MAKEPYLVLAPSDSLSSTARLADSEPVARMRPLAG